MKNIAIILASGTGSRTGLDLPKQFYKVAGKTVIEHTLDTFVKSKDIDEIIIVSHPDHIVKVQDIIIKNNYKKITKVLAGGSTRRESSYIGISAIKEDDAKQLLIDAYLNDVIAKVDDENICNWIKSLLDNNLSD